MTQIVKSLRVEYGDTLVALGAELSNLVVLEADLGKSTMGSRFEEAYPERFYEMGIAEANMVSVAAGLSLTGRIPFLASFAVFATGRCYDQIRTSVCIPKHNVKICGSSAGLSDFGDGATHQSVEDIAIMRALPNMQVFCPADANETHAILRYMATHPGPMYIRICRAELPVITPRDASFIPGRVRCLCKGQDAVIFASGSMVERALAAAETLRMEGISVSVVNAPSIKPLDEREVVTLAASHRVVVTAEEHSTIGGLGSAVTACIVKHIAKRVYIVGICDRFGTSAESYSTVMEAYGLSSEHIAQVVRNGLNDT